VPSRRKETMAFFWDRHVSSGIRELGYDIRTQTLAVVFPGRRMVYHRPVPFSVHASIFHAKFPERPYREIEEKIIPFVKEVPAAS
jgi:hypothetical protein